MFNIGLSGKFVPIFGRLHNDRSEYIRTIENKCHIVKDGTSGILGKNLIAIRSFLSVSYAFEYGRKQSAF